MSTRDQILEAAKEAYTAHGYDGLSLRAIAKEVGITPMAIYRHFKDKDDLMHHVVLHGLFLFGERMKEAENARDPWKRLLRVGEEYVAFSGEHRAYFEVVFLSTDRVSHLRHLTKEGARAFSSVFSTYEGWVKECLPAGTKQRVARETAIDIWAYSHGLVALHLAGRLSFLDVTFPKYHSRKLRSYLEAKKSELGV